jgi:ankyrin repeat protein
MKDFDFESFSIYEIIEWPLEILLSAGLDVDFSNDIETLLDIVIQRGNIRLVRLLVEAGADIYTVNHNHQTALVSAIDNRQVEVVRYFLEIGMDPNGTSDQRGWPLYYADGNDEIFQLLLDVGADRTLVPEFPEPE